MVKKSLLPYENFLIIFYFVGGERFPGAKFGGTIEDMYFYFVERKDMKVVNRKEFLAMPAGTLYTEFKPCYANGFAIKHDTLDNGDDWFYTELIASSVVCDGLVEMNDGKELPYDSNWQGRDGGFDQDQLFIVYSPVDIQMFADTLARLIGAK